jgi:hypothetical protein
MLLYIESCIFKYISESNIFILLFIDNILAAAPTKEIINRVKILIKDRFKIKKLRDIKQFLKFNIKRDRKSKRVFLT